MLRALLVVALVAAAVAVPIATGTEFEEGIATEIVKDAAGQAGFARVTKGSTPLRATSTLSTAEGRAPHVNWHQTTDPAVFDAIAMAGKKEIAIAATMMPPVIAETVPIRGAGKASTTWTAQNNAQVAVAASQTGDVFVAIEDIPDGWNLTAIVRVFTTDANKPLFERRINGYGDAVISPDGSKVAFAGIVNNSYVQPGNGLVEVYDVATGAVVVSKAFGQGVQPMLFGTFNARGELCLAIATDLVVMAADGSVALSVHRNYISPAVAFGDNYLAYGFMGTVDVQIRDAKSGQWTHQSAPIAGSSWVITLAASPNEKVLAVATTIGTKQNVLYGFKMGGAALTQMWNVTGADASSQQLQNVVSQLSFTQDSSVLAMSTWGDASNLTAQMSLLCATCGKTLYEMHTPGSMMGVAAHASLFGIDVVVGGKHVHANIMGAGGDLYSVTVPRHVLGCEHAGAAPLLDDDLIARINADTTTPWTAARSPRFEGVSVVEAQRLMGTHLTPPGAGVRFVPEEALDVAAMPTEFDATTQWPGCVHPIRDQAQCGSCWAFGASEALSDRLCVASHNKTNVVLSPEELVSCDTVDHGCGGGWLLPAWKFMSETGLPSDACFPYAAGGGQPSACTTQCADNSTYSTHKVAESTLAYYGNEADIMTALYTGGPIEVAFNVYYDFMHYSGGVYVQNSTFLMGGHAVKMVGWGVDSASGVKYWKVSNSWGTSWGVNGQFLIRRGTNECGIEYNSIWGKPE